MSDKKIRGLFVTVAGGMGGAERCLLSLVCGVDRSRIEPIVVVPELGELVPELKKYNIEVRQSPIRRWNGFKSFPGAQQYLYQKSFQARVDKLVRLIEREQIGIVVSNGMPCLEGAYAARKAGVPHIWNIMEMYSRDPGFVPLLPLLSVYSWIEQLTDALVVVSEGVAIEFQSHVPPELIRTIYTGIEKPVIQEGSPDIRTELGFKADCDVVLFVGLLSERKGVRSLIGAIPLVLKQFPEARFLLAGKEGGLQSYLESEIQRQQMGDSVRLLGQRPDVGRLLRDASLFVLPSLADPLPLSVLEAMSLGKPVVATRSGGCSEMVVHGKTGLLVEPNATEDLAQAICAMLADRATATRMGKLGEERFRELFSVPQYVDAFENLMRDLIQKNADKRSAAAPLRPLPELPNFQRTLKVRCEALFLLARERLLPVRDALRGLLKQP